MATYSPESTIGRMMAAAGEGEVIGYNVQTQKALTGGGVVPTQYPVSQLGELELGIGGGFALPQTQPAQQPMAQAGVGAVIPTALGMVGTAIPALAGIAGVLGAGWAAYQALGGGEGGGIGGINLLGGDVMVEPTTGVQLQGPGVLEPKPGQIIKQWRVVYGQPGLGNDYALEYTLVDRGLGKRPGVIMYNTKTGRYKGWILKKPYVAVIGKNLPNHRTLVRLRKNLGRHRSDADTILRLTSPQYLRSKVMRARRRR